MARPTTTTRIDALVRATGDRAEGGRTLPVYKIRRALGKGEVDRCLLDMLSDGGKRYKHRTVGTVLCLFVADEVGDSW